MRFSRRITQSYVVLAVALIVLVVLSSSILAFVSFATTFNESLDSANTRIEQRIEYYQLQHQTLRQFAPKLVAEQGSRARYKVNVFIDHQLVAGETPHPSSVALALGALLNIHPRHLHIDDGFVEILPDFNGFASLIGRYWLYTIPVGVIAVLIAWLVARTITRRAVRPLIDVTDALRAIAAGDFTPKLLVESDSGLHELTQAYNEVAQRLNVATIDQRRHQAEMRQFIADAGHELRTPLTIFMGYLDALRGGIVQDSSAVARVHETMLDETRKMRTIIEKLILLARMEREAEPLRDSIDLNSVAARAVDALRPLAGDRIRLDAAGAAHITGDDSELYEAVKNVVENAVRYAPSSAVDVRVRREDGISLLEVEDRGPGMQTVDVDHAFDRFYRGSTHGEIDGSGLGLAIAKRAVERMGGTIELDSQINRGTRVTMRFPGN